MTSSNVRIAPVKVDICQVREKELHPMEKVLQEIYDEAKVPVAPLTFVIVQKKHNLRTATEK